MTSTWKKCNRIILFELFSITKSRMTLTILFYNFASLTIFSNLTIVLIYKSDNISLGFYLDFAWSEYEIKFCLEDKRHDPTTTALRKYGWTFNPNVYRPKNNFITWLCAPRKIQPSFGT